MRSEFELKMWNAITLHVADMGKRQELLQLLTEESNRPFEQGDIDKAGNVILFTVSEADLERSGVIPEGYKLKRRSSTSFQTQMDEFVIAVQNVDPENYRERVQCDLAECFVDQVVNDPRTAEEGLWDDMRRTNIFTGIAVNL